MILAVQDEKLVKDGLLVNDEVIIKIPVRVRLFWVVLIFDQSDDITSRRCVDGARGDIPLILLRLKAYDDLIYEGSFWTFLFYDKEEPVVDSSD